MSSVTLLGLGKVVIEGEGTHAIYIPASTASKIVTIRNVTFKMQLPAQVSAVCVDGTTARLINCHVPELPGECGLLVHGGHAQVIGCSFQGTGKQAIEVRQGGSLDIRDSLIEDCFQGISAYGGARQVRVERCQILRSVREGVLVAGTKQNAATRAQRGQDHGRNQATLDAYAWGDARRLDLEVEILGSIISHSGVYGLSLDLGASINVHNSVLSSNAPFAVFIKGETDLFMCANQIIHGRKEGVHVGVNYGGNVTLRSNCFVGNRDSSVVQEVVGKLTTWQKTDATLLRWWSKPVTDVDNRYFTSGSQIPRASSHRDRFVPTHRNFTDEYDPYYYAIGNTFAHDLSANFDLGTLPSRTDTENHLSVFLGGCGDIRNLLTTAASVLNEQPDIKLRFLLNDTSLSILARDIILPVLIAESSSQADVLAVCANHELSAAQRSLVDNACNTLLGEPWPAWIYLPNDTSNSLKCQLQQCFEAFRTCTVSPQVVHDIRSSRDLLQEKALELTVTGIGAVDGKATRKEVEREARAYLASGNLTPTRQGEKRDFVNPTLFEAPTMRYNLYWSSSIYRAIRLQGEESVKGRKDSLYDRLLREIGRELKVVAEGLRNGKTEVGFVQGDVISIMLRPEGVRMDRRGRDKAMNLQLIKLQGQRIRPTPTDGHSTCWTCPM
ncbi:Zinc finger CCCH domain-containing protein 7A [Rhizophlyctis rosea]|nr:Zinc finger CCCH domain-containing protein 7A [Rhizophlyctis rosea]